ncbi:MAG: hypothetical protein SFX73_17880 [Kofleriaceae bacterium]|nr:hypothetical protein [Kofleriaceae bacterium]
MSDLPPPDLMDSSGRARRIVVSLLVGGAGGALAYFLGDRFIDTTGPEAAHVSTRQMSAGSFVIYLALAGFIATFAAALALQNYDAKKRGRDELMPQAKVRK